jgi:hypothetical protein
MSRALEDLRDWFRPKAFRFVAECEKDGFALRIVRTLTTELVQHAIWKIGREALTNDEKVALLAEGLYPDSFEHTRTNAAHAGLTPHGAGLAFDCLPLKDGKAWLNPPDEVWQRLYKVAERCGLDALGDPWGEFVSYDKGHFQEPGWRVYKTTT